MDVPCAPSMMRTREKTATPESDTPPQKKRKVDDITTGLCISLLLIEPYANESSQICPFLALRLQFERVHHQNRRLSSHSCSHESVIFLYFLD